MNMGTKKLGIEVPISLVVVFLIEFNSLMFSILMAEIPQYVWGLESTKAIFRLLIMANFNMKLIYNERYNNLEKSMA